VSEMVHNGSSHGAWGIPTDPHKEFEELCALSTTGELTAEDWARLTGHLAHCDACRELMRQYEGLIATTIPSLAAESATDQDEENAPGSWSVEEAEVILMNSLRKEPVLTAGHSISLVRSARWKHGLLYAVAALILVACSLGGYRIDVLREHGSEAAVQPVGSTATSTSPRLNPSEAIAVPTHENKGMRANDQAARLRKQAQFDQSERAKLESKLRQLEDKLVERDADLERSVADRTDLNRQLAEAQSDAQSLQARLSLIGDQASQDSAQLLALKAQVNDLNTAIEGKDKEIAEEQELLQHDRDIRNLIGARNLYIAEIYDVAKTGETEKPFGRVFYTKDKSLIFYGYDLDQQPGIKQAGVFQAWGGRGADRQYAVSLGLLYKDDANQKRWVLKFNDSKTISQIDAVFVTVEPEGGSAKPSGKPLLFTYLRLDPNHP
jgi:hypothetical protein